MLDFVPYSLKNFRKRRMVWIIRCQKLVDQISFKEAYDWAVSVRSNKVVCGEQSYKI